MGPVTRTPTAATAPVSLITAIVVALQISGCSAPPAGSAAPDAKASVGAASAAPVPAAHEPRSVTLRFLNETAGDIFIDATHGVSLTIRSDHGELTRSRFCRDSCGEGCGCRHCEPPAPRVRAIRPGEAFDVEWRGEHVVPGRCASEAACDCDEERKARSGNYDFVLRGSRATLPARARPAGDDPSMLAATLDGSRGSCTARGVLSLGDGQSTYEVSFSCDKR